MFFLRLGRSQVKVAFAWHISSILYFQIAGKRSYPPKTIIFLKINLIFSPIFLRLFTNLYHQQILTIIRFCWIVLKCCLDNRSQNVPIFSEKWAFLSQNIRIILVNFFRENGQHLNQMGYGYFALRYAVTLTKLDRFWTKMIKFFRFLVSKKYCLFLYFLIYFPKT